MDGLIIAYSGSARFSLVYSLSKTFTQTSSIFQQFHTETDFPKRLNQKAQWREFMMVVHRSICQLFFTHMTRLIS